MQAAKNDDTVRVNYTGTLEDGTVFDSSASREPLEFTIGAGEVIPGFEQAVIGMTPGESKQQKIAAEQAYGPRRGEMTIEVDRGQIPPELELEVGQQLQIEGPQGEVGRVTVSGLSEQTVTLDGNHPLAGKDLVFDIELVEIRAA